MQRPPASGSVAALAAAAMEALHQRLGQASWLVLRDLLPADSSSPSGTYTLAAAAADVRRQARDADWPAVPAAAAASRDVQCLAVASGTDVLRFPADATAWSAVNRLALHGDLIAGAALLLGEEEADVRLVAASVLAPSATSRERSSHFVHCHRLSSTVLPYGFT